LQTARETFGAALLLAIEVLVAADLIGTVAVEPTLDNVTALGMIVLIRTLLSFALQIELDGVPPWRRAMVGGASRPATAPAPARPGRAAME
jgi:hypothetical protein